MAQQDDKVTKMHGGLIRREDRVETDRNGHTSVQHWDGRKDVHIVATPVNTRTRQNDSGER